MLRVLWLLAQQVLLLFFDTHIILEEVKNVFYYQNPGLSPG